MDIINRTMHHLHTPGECPSAEWVRDAVEKYPYFVVPLMLYARGKGNDEALNARLALFSPDRMATAHATGAAPAHFLNFYPTEQPASSTSTFEAIDTFLQNFGHTSQSEVEAISTAIFNPTPDYADVLAAQGGSTEANDEQDRLIDSFIEQSKRQDRMAAQQVAQQQQQQQETMRQEARMAADDTVQAPEQENNSMLSESLAKMYIARRKYSKALEIIENINLNFPEKSVYFADQIRFLTKLVMNEKAIQQEQ